MRVTQFTEFALRILMRLSWEPQRVFTTRNVAEELRLSRNHLTKIIQELRGAGYVETQRGAGGGFRLARPADRISIGEVMRRLEGGAPLVECFRSDGGGCVLTPVCRLRLRLATAQEAFFRELDGLSLAECSFPGALRRIAASEPAALAPRA